ncbi:fungal-specific transcription factor domain-containing protein [Myxozyma melibiosi]|uniref:Fungal-specific transcription factor domain-containing protein n=1 Tax=Myxozyma melibiosi TaxID=54550 RepID=A0ABR1F7L2_9ASCO
MVSAKSSLLQDTAATPAPKVKQSKSRNGCATCKAKRLKCDETKPTCLQCRKRNVECGGYKRDFKWRLFEESSITKRKKGDPSPATSSASFVVVPTPSPSSSSPAFSRHPSSTFAPPTSSISLSSNTDDALLSPLHPSTEQAVLSSGANSGFSPLTAPDDDSVPILSFDSSGQIISPNSDMSALIDPAEYLQSTYTPALNQELSNLTASMASLGSHPLSLLSPNLIMSSSTTNPLDDNSPDNLAVSRRQSSYFIDPTGPVSSSDVLLIPSMPTLDPTTRTALFFHTATASVMSMKDTPSDNPWRTLFWPLAHSHMALYHGLAAMASFHAAATHPAYRIDGVDHMRLAISELVNGLNNNMPTDVALATTITLAFAEAWDRHISTGIAHLRGAKILIRQFVSSRRGLPSSVQQSPIETARLKRFKSLYNSWMYIAMIAKLTSDDDDDTGGPVAQDEYEIFSAGGFDTVDPLMGCAQTLFPIIGKVATLVRHVRLSGRDDIYVAGAIALKEELEMWQPSIREPYNACEDPAYDSSSCIATAQAYKYATLLYLYQCVPSLAEYCPPRRPSETDDISSPSSVIELELGVQTESPTKVITAKLLEMLASVPTTSRTCVVHIFPLLSVACEVDSPQMRAIARKRWADLSRLLQMGNVDRAFDVIEEVWTRKDVMKGQWKLKVGFTHWSTVMREWGWEVLLG